MLGRGRPLACRAGDRKLSFDPTWRISRRYLGGSQGVTGATRGEANGSRGGASANNSSERLEGQLLIVTGVDGRLQALG